MTQSSSELSIGLVIRSNKIWRWQSELIRALSNAPSLSIVSLVILGDELPALSIATAGLHKLDSVIFHSPMAAFEQIELDAPSSCKVYSYSKESDLADISDHDFWINFSERKIPTDLMTIVTPGLLETRFSMQEGVEALNSSRFGITEFARGDKQSYFSIVGHTSDESLQVLAESRPSLDNGPLSRNLNQHFKLIEVSWLRLFEALQTKSFEEAARKKLSLKKSSDLPSAEAGSSRALLKIGSIFLDKFSQKFLRKEQWVLLMKFQDQSVASNQLPLAFSEYIELSPPDDCFWADPFIVSESGRHYLFFEELPFATDKGHLSCMEVFDDGRHTEPKVILNKPYHLSYPNVFAYESDYYLVPESGDNASIELYRSTSFPYEWEHQHNLMEGLHAYDSTLIEHDGIWWLFACVAAQKGMSGNEELHIFYADSPLSQSWSPHQLNPVISDASCARPAGKFFNVEGKLYRPSQDCAGSYGAGLNINLIRKLNRQDYQEELVQCSRPDWDTKLTALHTLNFNQHVSVADAMRVDSRFL